MLIAFSLTTGQDTRVKGKLIKHLNKNKFESKLEKDINEQPIDRLIRRNNQKLQEIKQQEQQRESQQKTIEQHKWMTIRLSYYTSNLTDCNKTDGITSSGKYATFGTCAAPKEFLYGTTFKLENGQELTVQDRGGAIKIHDGVIWLDVFIPGATEKELDSMGVKYVKAYIK